MSKVVVPNFQNMFSQNRHHPRTSVTYRRREPANTRGVDRYMPYERAEVTGRDRVKFFRRPMVPSVPSAATNILFAHAARPGAGTANPALRPRTPATKTIAIQTLFRYPECRMDSPG